MPPGAFGDRERRDDHDPSPVSGRHDRNVQRAFEQPATHDDAPRASGDEDDAGKLWLATVTVTGPTLVHAAGLMPRRSGDAQEYLPPHSRNRCAEDYTRCDKQGCARHHLTDEAGHNRQHEQNGHERRSLRPSPPCAAE